MLDHLLPRVYTDCDFADSSESNKENVGYFVRRPTASLRSEYDGTPVLHRRVSRGRRTPSPVGLGGVARHLLRGHAAAAMSSASTITPQDAKKKVMQKKKTTTKQDNALKTPKKKNVKSSKKAETSKKVVSSQSIGIIRRPLQDITHMYVNERPTVAASRRERMVRETLSTSASMRFF
ncbi:hypothetical protein Gpo141_00012302 [Globisporangium polare]